MTERTDERVVPPAARGQRLDVWLSGLSEAGSRSQIAAAISLGNVTIDGVLAKPSRRLRGGEVVRVARTAAPDTQPQTAQPIPLEVLYEDAHVVAINKPPGLVVHPGAGHRDGTLVNALLHHFPSTQWPNGPERAGLVHRLDRQTSGVLLVARSVVAHEGLSRQFRARSVEKIYLALVRGSVSSPGRIELAIGRHRRDRTRMSVRSSRGRAASTAYEPIESLGAATLLIVKPRTGRTHQIRVHLASRGWPVVADPIYGVLAPRTASRWLARWGESARVLASLPRQALHAWRIEFLHPITGTRMRIEAPLAADLAETLDRLRACSRTERTQGDTGEDKT